MESIIISLTDKQNSRDRIKRESGRGKDSAGSRSTRHKYGYSSRGQERLSILQRGKSKIYFNYNLLRYSKGEEASCYIKRKEGKVKIVERKNSIYKYHSLDYRTRWTGIELHYHSCIKLCNNCL